VQELVVSAESPYSTLSVARGLVFNRRSNSIRSAFCFYQLLCVQMKLRFSIRDLLWLTLVVALCVGWWIDQNSYRKVQKKYSIYRMQHDFLEDADMGMRWRRESNEWVLEET
jgi:hypothetical protein